MAGDLDADETDENTLACDMDNARGLVDEPVTSEGHCIPTGAVQPRVEVVDNQCQERRESIGRWEADASIDQQQLRHRARELLQGIRDHPSTGKEVWKGERGDEDQGVQNMFQK